MKSITKKDSWDLISPTWPLQNIIACNPLQGFEDLKFDDAIKRGHELFQNKQIPAELEKVNQLTIKWCQVFFDSGQATVEMPNRSEGFFKSWKKLAIFDDHLHGNSKDHINFIKDLPDSSKEAISIILQKIKLTKKNQDEFLNIILTTLSGWSSYVKYLAEWSHEKNDTIKNDYLAIRLAMVAIIFGSDIEKIFSLAAQNKDDNYSQKILSEISKNENEHRFSLVEKINNNKKYLGAQKNKFDAQLIFCIDVRSEPMRRAIESCGNYQTFGFAGFFGVPVAITNSLNQESYASCPVLISPKHNVNQKSNCSHKIQKRQASGHRTISEIKKFYQSLKYNFTTPLPLAEAMGIWSGSWMLIKTFSPKSKKFLHKIFNSTLKQDLDSSPEIDSIPIEDQGSYALGALKAIGLVDNFSEIIVLCGHGSKTENNAHATSLDCGACGGRHGDSNAKILAKILNQNQIRKHLKKEGINIPNTTRFIAAKHNTTNDEIEIYEEENFFSSSLEDLKFHLDAAKRINNSYRAKEMGYKNSNTKLSEFFFKRTDSWSETQNEWGLARNGFFIVAPRDLTKNIDLEGRSFLHSYNWEIDNDDSILHLILNAPLVVAQWINSQYLFSTIDNIGFGSGSKITQNVVGKIGVMQGNASDLMNGLTLQSVYINDHTSYHKPARLLAIIYAPSEKIDRVLSKSPKIKQLVMNEWISIYCLDPKNQKFYCLGNDLLWKQKQSS